MTPQEKAEELTEKNFLILSKRGEHHYTFDYSKQCALIAVDEILRTQRPDSNTFWQEVKKEIEAL